MNPEPVLISLVVYGTIVIGFFLWTRYKARVLTHKETLAALEKGVGLPERQSAPWTPRVYLLQGLIWLFVGIPIAIAAFAFAASMPRALPVTMAVVPAALGLIPIGVGIAYLIFYRVESKKLLS